MLEIIHLGLTKYDESLACMEDLHKQVVLSGESRKGFLLVVQHPQTVTMGKRFLAKDMHVAPEDLKSRGVDFCQVDRGGSVTVHEPGQIVIYPILNLNAYKKTVRTYVCLLEQSMIDLCVQLGLRAFRDPAYPGVWTAWENPPFGLIQSKIGAVGVRISKGVTKHGLAFNVENSLETFSYIVPCGIVGKGVTSLKRALKASGITTQVSYQDVEKSLVKSLLTGLQVIS